MAAKTTMTVKVAKVSGEGERRLVTVGRIVMRSESAGVLYLDLLPVDYPLFLKREQPAPGVRVYSVTMARAARAVRPGMKPVFYSEVGVLEVPERAGDARLELNFLPTEFVLIPSVPATVAVAA